ncbi:MAG: hypothetical protein K0R34_3298 [Herbinix sp.]|jgi:hypothetical protein|nr:hypothetical protein [Herbinix sp.]
MSLIEKIDAKITECKTEADRYYANHRYESSRIYYNMTQAWKEAKKLILSEQKEPCGWCKENYRFEFNWIDDDGSTVTTDDHMVIGGIADYCPVCGRLLNQPYTETN